MNMITHFNEEELDIWKDVVFPFPVTFEGKVVAEILEIDKKRLALTIKILDTEAGEKVKALVRSGSLCGMSVSSKPNAMGGMDRSAWLIK